MPEAYALAGPWFLLPAVARGRIPENSPSRIGRRVEHLVDLCPNSFDRLGHDLDAVRHCVEVNRRLTGCCVSVHGGRRTPDDLNVAVFLDDGNQMLVSLGDINETRAFIVADSRERGGVGAGRAIAVVNLPSCP